MQRPSGYKGKWCTAVFFCLSAFISTQVFAATVKVGGTGAAVGTMRLLGKAFERAQRHHTVKVYDSLGTGGGIKALLGKRLDIAVASRDIKAAEAESGLAAHKYGTSAFVFISHPKTETLQLTPAKIADIYSDQFASWSNGAPLRLVLRPLGDFDTRQLIRISGDIEVAVAAAHARKGMIMAMTDTAAADQVELTPGAFTTSTLAIILSEGRHVTMHPVDGVLPSMESLVDGSYPHTKDLYLVTASQPSEAVRQFAAFVRSAQGADILRTTGHKID
ncbi:hypothetical protein CR155_01065 [Pollutimonas nitritireducens]|uniref:PBP domain-containing protein n=1 Tax=Pollutimonas nitritireducens TaxID=2045209 RepID=A0A2N4UKX3_9BURK|nr:substrate-binding domain-containing protein [Pollutimonas nitritireducens]PLC55677.1 hypothetical protein CR155_01065 [Pollutimonas nitritireducens]